MFTISRQSGLWITGVAALGIVTFSAAKEPAHEAYQLSYHGAPLNFGTAPTAADLEGEFAYPADGRGLPSGSGTYAQGKQVYAQQCLACHGDKLQGGIGDRLIGGRGTLNTDKPVKTVESYWPYATTLFDYIKRAMPFTAPGSLTNDQIYAVTAYILGEANIIPKDEVVDAKTLPKVQMPNRDGFVTEDPRPDVR
jgi:cytochrome c